MKTTVNSIIRIQNEDFANILATLNKFKAVQDIPCEDIEYEKIDEFTVELIVKYPLAIFDRSVTQFLAILFGELPYQRGFGTLRFMKLELPEEVLTWFQGPKFGVEGIKQQFGFKQFPFLMSIIKPSIDPSVDQTTLEQRLQGPLAAGFHAVKDDEMQGNLPNLPLSKRFSLAVEHKGYIPAINVDDIDTFKKFLSDERLTMVLVNASIIGFPLLNQIRRITSVPILSHLSLQGTFNSSFSPALYACLHRLFGCDAFITAIGDSGYYNASHADELDIVEILTSELVIKKTLPILSGGARLHNLKEIIAPYENKNFPYGLAFGALIFNSDQNPKDMAKQVMQVIARYQAELGSVGT